jgi:hypothetical protein
VTVPRSTSVISPFKWFRALSVTSLSSLTNDGWCDSRGFEGSGPNCVQLRRGRSSSSTT